jgi:uncharacterized membrane protein YeaQ/YmgE (transglycosylase-associated protein family)
MPRAYPWPAGAKRLPRPTFGLRDTVRGYGTDGGFRCFGTDVKGGSMDIIVWLVVGLIAGAIARFLVPGRDAMGWLGTLVLGLIGSLIGGFLGDALASGDQDFSPAGLIGSIIGAIIALIVYRVATRRSAT